MRWLALALIVASTGVPGSPARSTDEAVLPIIQQHSLGAVRLTLTGDRQRMAIDGRLQLTLEVEAPARATVALPEIGARLGPFVVAGQSASGPTARSGEMTLWRCEYILEAERVGELVVPALVVAIESGTAAGGGARRLATEPLTVTVTSVLPPDAELGEPKDIAPPLALPNPGGRWWPWLLAAAIGLGLLAGLAWRRRRRAWLPAALPSRPAHLLALAELERLQAEAAGGAAAEELCSRLADLLKRYLVGRFGLSATARTTEELLSAERSGPIAPRRQLIGPVLAICDLVKFARHRPGTQEVETSLRQTREFIVQTAGEQAGGGGSAAASRS